ncbi:MAG: XrtA-associated tyrosine autokinase [Gammaproteobacteria bacterium]|nr:XrtA-associated tyrosine autokinase [Gammaproteobacteria bacterium]
MSIIERALDKLEKQRDVSPPAEGETTVGDIKVLDPRPDLEKDSSSTRPAFTPSALELRALEQVHVAPAAPAEPEAAAGGETTPPRSSREVTIDLERLTELGMLTPDNPQSTLSEQMRRIKRPLLSKLEEGASEYTNLIMVTSALPGEGKTYTSINLAISIAMEMDRTVLLVDSDVAKSDITKSFGVEATRGLTDCLEDENLDLSEVMLKTNIPKLSILPSGSHHAKMTELLASGGMKKFIDDVSKRYSDRVVIFDSPPVLVTSGAGVLASLVGQVVFVVHAEKTLASEVKDALKQLNRRQNIGLVLNRSREWGGAKGKYGYYYYYGRD